MFCTYDRKQTKNLTCAVRSLIFFVLLNKVLPGPWWKKQKELHLKITVAWQGRINGLAIQNNCVTPKKARYFFYWKKRVIQLLAGKWCKWFKGHLLINSLVHAVAQERLFKLKNIWKVASEERGTITHWTDVFLSTFYPLHLWSVWDSRIVTEHLLCFIFVHFLKNNF